MQSPVDPETGPPIPPPPPERIAAPAPPPPPPRPAATVPTPPPLPDEASGEPSPWREWFREDGYWYITSAVVHAIGFVIFAICIPLLPESLVGNWTFFGEAPSFEAADLPEAPDTPIDHFQLGDAPLDPTELNTGTLMLTEPPGRQERRYDDSSDFEEAGGGQQTTAIGPPLAGLGAFPTIVNGPGIYGPKGIGVGVGTGPNPGSGGGDGYGFGGRGRGKQSGVGGGGGTKQTERAVAAALNWLSRHQAPAGNWSLKFTRQCRSEYSCSGPGSVDSDAAATALALLPFLGAGQTHKDRGPYQKAINRGIAWLVKRQKDDGDLSCDAPQRMYSHGLATIALCEAYGMTRDEYVGRAAAKALRFIEAAQHPITGGWRYQPGDPGDTSVLGWQMMALKSGRMAGLGVDSMCMENVRKWLDSVARGEQKGLFCYQPYKEPTPPMTAVGLLCHQYLGTPRDAASMIEGRQYLLNHPPSNDADRDTYYWYYATMAMHNFMGREWDEWNRQMRRALVTTQCREGCAEGSWDPERPAMDKWGGQGGRLMTTCLATLTLEVYYRYLPLFKSAVPPAAPPAPNKTTLANGGGANAGS